MFADARTQVWARTHAGTQNTQARRDLIYTEIYEVTATVTVARFSLQTESTQTLIHHSFKSHKSGEHISLPFGHLNVYLMLG